MSVSGLGVGLQWICWVALADARARSRTALSSREALIGGEDLVGAELGVVHGVGFDEVYDVGTVASLDYPDAAAGG